MTAGRRIIGNHWFMAHCLTEPNTGNCLFSLNDAYKPIIRWAYPSGYILCEAMSGDIHEIIYLRSDQNKWNRCTDIHYKIHHIPLTTALADISYQVLWRKTET